ncbi:MAG: two-component regulator propeller domain-containing protein [Telluria sp.]
MEYRRLFKPLCAALAVAALALAGAPARAQTRPGLVSFQRLAMPDDVPATLSSVITQDPAGFLWIGTQDGLVRYDGYHFRTFRPAARDEGSLGGSYVRALLPGPNGVLWVGTMSGGLSRYDPATERFIRYRHDDKNNASIAHDHVEALAAAPGGLLWAGTDAGLDLFDPAAGVAVRHIRPQTGNADALAATQVRSLLVDRSGRLWVGTHGALQWTRDGRHFTRLPQLEGADVVQLFEDKQGRLWAGTTGQGAFVIDGAAVTQFGPGDGVRGLSHFWVHGFAEVAGSEIWIATFGGGIDVVDARTLEVVDRLRRDSASQATIGSDRIGALAVDRSGIAWVGTWGGGLARHDPSTRAFRKLRYLAGGGALSHPEVVRPLAARDGSWWLGTNGNGIDVLGPDGSRIAEYRADPHNPRALANGSISCLEQGPDGSIWAATLDGTLHRLRPGAHGFERITQGLPGGPIRAIVFDHDGQPWIGSLNGLARLDPDGRAAVWKHDEGKADTLSASAVESLAFGRDGTLWVGTEDGLNAFDPRTGRAVRIRRDSARADALPENWIPDLLLAHDGKLWVGTPAGVAILRFFDGRTASFDLPAERMGMPARPVQSLAEDNAGQVWINGRTRIDPAHWSWRSYGPADGAEFRTLFIASRARTHDGTLLFGSPEGLLAVDPARLQEWRYEPVVNAVSYKVDGRNVAAGGLAAALAPGQHDVRIEFAASDLSAPAELHYRYRMDGYDDGWIAVDASQRIAAYTRLPPGQYKLHVHATNRAGAWSPHEWTLDATLRPAFWQTWWFKSLCALAGALALAGAYRLRVRQLRRRGAELERVVAARTADLAAAYERIEEASLTDPLTGLRNRRFLEQTIQQDLELAARRHASEPPEANSDLVLLMLDLDHFKQVNDIYGHAAGDAVLAQTAQVLKGCMRASDYIVRWGGEEFLLVARFIDREQAPVLAEKIRCAIAAHPFALPDGSVLRKTVSIGYAAFPFVPGAPDVVTLDTLQRIADTALYAAKKSWRDAWVGVMAGEITDRETADAFVKRFLSDAQSSVARGEVRAIASPHDTEMRWN